MIEYGEPIKKDITDIKILVKCSTREEGIIVTEKQLYRLLDRVDIGSVLYIIVFDGYGYDILSFVSVITSSVDKIMLKEKIRRVLQDWKSKQYKQE